MKKIMSLILALTIILSFGTFAAQAATTEATNVTTVAPVNYAKSGLATVKGMANKTSSSIFTDTADNSTINTSTDCFGLQGINNNARETNNTFFVVKLTNEQYVSAIVVDQYKSRIEKYRIFATSDEELGEEAFVAAETDKGLTERGKEHRIKEKKEGTTNQYVVKETIRYNDENEVYTIDKLYADNALVASGTLVPDDAITTEKNTFYFDKTVKAKYIIFVVDSTKELSHGTPIDYIEVLGTTEANSTDFVQYPKTYLNYADKSVYPVVDICGANDYETTANKKTYGTLETLVDPNNENVPTGTNAAGTVMLPNGGSATPNSWIAIDLGQERKLNSLELYQWKYRISEAEVYALTADGFAEAKANGGKQLDAAFLARYATYITTKSIVHDKGTYSNLHDVQLNVGDGNYSTPDVINFGREVKCSAVLLRVTGVTSSNNSVILKRITAKGSVTTYENAYVGGTINYTTKFVNDTNETKMYAIVEAQYNAADEMIASNIKYVNVDPLYSKSFAGEIIKNEAAKTIKVFSICVNNLVPLDTQYTFNIQ